MMDNKRLIGKRVRVRWDNAPKDFFYTITEVIENSESMLIFKDRTDEVYGINKRFIKEIS